MLADKHLIRCALNNSLPNLHVYDLLRKVTLSQQRSQLSEPEAQFTWNREARLQILPANVCVSTDHLSIILSVWNILCFKQTSQWKGGDFASDQEDSILPRTTSASLFIQLSQPQQKMWVLNTHRKGISNRNFNNSYDKLENFQKRWSKPGSGNNILLIHCIYQKEIEK